MLRGFLRWWLVESWGNAQQKQGGCGCGKHEEPHLVKGKPAHEHDCDDPDCIRGKIVIDIKRVREMKQFIGLIYEKQELVGYVLGDEHDQTQKRAENWVDEYDLVKVVSGRK